MTKKFNVDPYYTPRETDLFVLYTYIKHPTSQLDFYGMNKQEVKDIMGFNILFDDLTKSYDHSADYMRDHHIIATFPKGIAKPYVMTNADTAMFLTDVYPEMGLSVRTFGEMKAGTVIAEYIGERVPAKTSIKDTTYSVHLLNGEQIDAKNYGGIARFFNHCPTEHENENVLTANLMLLTWVDVTPSGEEIEKAFLMTKRDVQALEPLCFDYGNEYNFGEKTTQYINKETFESLEVAGNTDSHVEEL